MGKAAIFGGIGNIEVQQFPVLQLGTSALQIGKAIIYAGASY